MSTYLIFLQIKVSKAPEDSVQSAISAVGVPGAQVPIPSALRVTIPAELQGVAFISVICKKGHILNKTFVNIIIYQ